MRRVVGGLIVVLVTVVTPPVAAQIGAPWWVPDDVEVLESDGEVVLTLSFSWRRPGRVRYRTVQASASEAEDYTAVTGEVVFTDTSGSTTIRIPIADDDRAERVESFTVEAWEEPTPDPWAGTGRASVRIIDDDGEADGEADGAGGEPAGTATTATTTAGRRPSRPRSVPIPLAGLTVSTSAGADAAIATTVPSRPSDREAELASGDLRPGPGFELPTDGPVEGAPDPGGGRGGATGLGMGLGTAAMSVGAVAWVQRRRRWSPKRA